MDEYLEQVPSSSWLEGVGSMVVDAIEPSQNFSRMMPSVVELMGETENQALYSNKHQDAFFDTHQDHLQLRDLSEQPLDSDGMVQPLFRQSPQSHSFVGCSWQEPIGGVARPAMGIQGRSRAFPSEEEISNDFFSGKRIRGNNVVSMGNGAQPQENGERVLSVVTNGPTKPRVRARRGQATDPHSIAERNRRDRIAERMKALQELVPDSNKTDKASMLDEIISYVKFLQMQVKCLSMCRLGGTAVAAPLLADLPVEEYANLITANFAQANGMAVASQDGIAFTERQVARLMDEDTSAAMQYLQSKGLCLMPISLATAISSTGTTTQVTLSKTENADGGKKESTVVQAFAANNSTTVGNNNLVNLHDSLCKEKL